MAITEFPIFTTTFEELDVITDAQATDSDGVLFFDESVGVMKRMARGELFKGKVIPINSIADFPNLLVDTYDDRQQFHLNSFAPDGSSGGGPLMWAPDKPKSLHDGIRYFSPTVPIPADFNNETDVQNYMDGVGEEFPTADGIFELTLYSIQSSEFPSIDGAFAIWDGPSGSQLKNGVVPSIIGIQALQIPNISEVSYARFNADETISMRTLVEHKTDLLLNNVDNTSDADKPISTDTQTALNLKANSADVADALALKAPLASPALTGNPTAPTQPANANDTTLANTAFVQGELTDRIQSVATIADLSALTGVAAGQIFDVLEYSTGLGYGGGRVKAIAGTVTPDNVITFASATAGIYFERLDVSVVDCDMAGIAGDGVTDDTSKLDAAMLAAAGKKFYLNRHCRMTITQFGGLFVPANTTVEFGPAGKIELLAHNASNYGILQIYNVENVTLINPVVDGRRDLNSAVTGEFGMGVHIRGTSGKVVVHNPITNNCWGDGIYVGASPEKAYCDDVEVNGHRANNNRRQGASIVSALRCVFNDPEWTNTNGTPPEAGCDIEPDNNAHELKFIRINNPITSGNSGAGINVYLGSLPGALVKYVDIAINNHQDDGSTVGYQEDRVEFGANIVRGRITNSDPVYQNSVNSGIVFRERAAGAIRTVVSRPTIIDWNTAGNTAIKYAPAISILRDEGATTTEPIGGVSIINPTVKLVNSTATSLFYAADLVTANNTADIEIIDPIDVDVTNYISVLQKNAVVFTDRFRQVSRSLSANTTLVYTQYTPHVEHNRASTSIFTLDSSVPLGSPSIKIQNKNTGTIRVIPPAGGSFLGATAGQYYQSGASAGHEITVTPLGGDIWRVDGLAGTWTLLGP